MASLVNSTKHVKRLTSPLQILPQIEEDGTLSITLIPRPDKDTKRKLQTHIPDKDWCKNSKQNTNRI